MAEEEKRSFVRRLVSRKGHLIHKIKAKDGTGNWAYYFLLVEPLREKAFLQALEDKAISDLSRYGEIIASCYGEQPTDELRDYLKEQYGFVV